MHFGFDFVSYRLSWKMSDTDTDTDLGWKLGEALYAAV